MSMRALQSSPGLIAQVLAGVVFFACAGSTQAGILFSDSFRYSSGALAGNSGGSGWADGSSWSGGGLAGGNQVTSPLLTNPADPSARSVRIATNGEVSSRTLSNLYVTGITSYFVSFVFNASPYENSYAGVTLTLDTDSTQSLFMGMPGGTGELGFDWTGSGYVTYAAATATNYLVLFEIRAGASVTSVLMYATTNMMTSGSALAGSTALASLMNEPMFSFDTVRIGGGASNARIAGLAMADNPTDAVAFTQSAMPGPAPLALGLLAGAFGGSRGRARRRGTAG